MYLIMRIHVKFSQEITLHGCYQLRSPLKKWKRSTEMVVTEIPLTSNIRN